MKLFKSLLKIAAGVVLAVGPYTFLHVCGNMSANSEMGDMAGMGMSGGAPCHGIPLASLITGLVLIVVGIISLVIDIKNADSKNLSTVLDVATAIVGVVAIGIPTFIIGVCSSAHMHCHMVTRPALIIIGSLLVVIGLAGTVSRFATSKNSVAGKGGSVLLNEQAE